MIFHPNEAITYHEIEVCKIIMDNTFGEPVRLDAEMGMVQIFFIK